MVDHERKSALYEQLARVGKAVAHGTRLELLDVLAQGERSVDALARATNCSVTNTSAHLRVLREGGLVEARKEGTRVRYRLAAGVGAFAVSLRELARGRLGDVDRAADAYLGPATGVTPVDRAELYARLRRGDVVVVDVRPAEEYEAGHIPGALSIPLDELEQRLSELPDDVEVVAYCRGPLCVYSPEAVRVLRRHGRHARQLEDGFPEWQLAGLPVASGTTA